MTNDQRITALAQDIYIARHNQTNSVTGSDLLDFENQTISWINQYIPEFEKEANWNISRTNDDPSLGVIPNGTTISYALPATIRKLIMNPHRDLTIRQDSTIITTFRLVSPNQTIDPNDHDIRNRATVVNRKVIFSRPLNSTEIGGMIVADTIAWIPRLSISTVVLLDILDMYPDIRQLFVLGVLKNQVLPDIVQGGLTPSFTQKYADLLQLCIADNNESADSDYTDYEDLGYIRGIGW